MMKADAKVTRGRPVIFGNFAAAGQVLPASTKRVGLWVFPPPIGAAPGTNVSLSDHSGQALGFGINYNQNSAPFYLGVEDTGNWIQNALFANTNNLGTSLSFIDVLEE